MEKADRKAKIRANDVIDSHENQKRDGIGTWKRKTEKVKKGGLVNSIKKIGQKIRK